MPKETNKKQGKEKKHVIKDFKAELKRVIWPTPKQLLNNTIAVITIVLITAVIVFGLDFAFEKLNQYGIEGLKSVVDVKNETEEHDHDHDHEDESTQTNSESSTNSEVTNEQSTNTETSKKKK